MRNESQDTVAAPSGSPRTLRRVVPAVPAELAALRAEAQEFARRAGAEEAVVADVALAISEAATNVVLHAYGDSDGRIELVAKAEGRWLEFDVTDDGRGFRPSPSGGLGFGLKVRAEISDSMTVLQREQGTTIALRFARVREPEQLRER
jgi:anti-sigma regulatory factor (Ser/Thr protein kinase)